MDETHHVLLVPIQVKPECIEEFAQAAHENAAESCKEPGVIRFEVLHNQQDKTNFVLLEVYHSPEGHKQHQQTPHYKRFKEKVPTLVQEPYQVGLYQFASSAL